MKATTLFLSIMLIYLSCSSPQPESKTSHINKEEKQNTSVEVKPSAVPPTNSASTKAAPTVELVSSAACNAKMDSEGKVSIKGTHISKLDYKDLFDSPYEPPSLVTWPFDKDTILVALKPNWYRQHGADPDGVLWEIPCDNPQKATIFLELKGADFGNAAFHTKNHILYFSGPQGKGVGALDLQTKEIEYINKVSLLSEETCWLGGDPENPLYETDVVLRIEEKKDLLVLERGGPCGFEADWESQVFYLKNINDPKKRTLHQPKPISTITADADGALWMGDAGKCSSPGIQDPQTRGVIFHSSDEGKAWKKIKVKTKDGEMATAAKTILADPKKPGHLVVYSAYCDNGGASFGGSVFLSKDEGKTWKTLSLSPEIEKKAYADEGSGLSGVTLAKNSLDHLIVFLRVYKENGTHEFKRWETKDEGKTWKALSSTKKLPENQAREAKLGNVNLLATEDGLLQKSNGKETRIFPE